jgi:hypothetical protein
MNSIRATALFTATFTLRGLVDVIGAKENFASVLLGMALLTSVAALAFWLGARRASYRWYHAALAGFLTFALISALLLSLPSLSRWVFLCVITGASVLISLFLARLFGKSLPMNNASSTGQSPLP